MLLGVIGFKIEGAWKDGYRIGLFALLGDDDDDERDFTVVRGFNDKMNLRILDIFGLLVKELKGDLTCSLKLFSMRSCWAIVIPYGPAAREYTRNYIGDLVKRGKIQRLRPIY